MPVYILPSQPLREQYHTILDLTDSGVRLPLLAKFIWESDRVRLLILFKSCFLIC